MRTRLPISTREAEILWVQWKLGATISHIGRMIGRKPGTVHGYLSRFGGIAPRVRIQGRRTLSMAEREEISRGLAAGLSARAIARAIGRAPSTVTREIARNGGRRKYRSTPADGAAIARRRRPQPLRLERAVDLRELVEDKLSLDWSPEQMAAAQSSRLTWRMGVPRVDLQSAVPCPSQWAPGRGNPQAPESP